MEFCGKISKGSVVLHVGKGVLKFTVTTKDTSNREQLAMLEKMEMRFSISDPQQGLELEEKEPLPDEPAGRKKK